jgi:hypothetical protein
MTQDIATAAVQLGFISSVYMDITKSVRSPELIALLDFCREEQKTLLMAIDCNAHSYLFSDCENNRRLEIDGLIAEYGLEVYNRGITPTFTGAGPNSTVNYSAVDITLSLNMPKDHKIEEWKVSNILSGSDHQNITLGYRAGRRASKETKMGRNYHRADWARFQSLLNTNKMQKIAKSEMWTELLIKEMTRQWYDSVDKAFNKFCPLKKIKIKDEADWVILGIAIAVWIFHRKKLTKHRRWHAALLALTYSPEEQTLRHAEGGDAKYKHPQCLHGQGSQLGCPPTP